MVLCRAGSPAVADALLDKCLAGEPAYLEAWLCAAQWAWALDPSGVTSAATAQVLYPLRLGYSDGLHRVRDLCNAGQ